MFGKTKESHDVNLQEILNIMSDYGLEENLEKRILCVEHVSFLGYEITNNKIFPSLERAQGITDLDQPKNKKGVQRIIGLMNYDRMFIPPNDGVT